MDEMLSDSLLERCLSGGRIETGPVEDQGWSREPHWGPVGDPGRDDHASDQAESFGSGWWLDSS